MKYLESKSKLMKGVFYTLLILIGFFFIICANDNSNGNNSNLYVMKIVLPLIVFLPIIYASGNNNFNLYIEIIKNIGFFLISYVMLDFLNNLLEKIEEKIEEKYGKEKKIFCNYTLEKCIFILLSVINICLFLILFFKKEIFYGSMFFIPVAIYIFKMRICEYTKKEYFLLTIKDRLVLSSCILYTILIYFVLGCLFKVSSVDYVVFQLVFFNKYLDYLKKSLPSAIHCDLRIVEDIKEEFKDIESNLKVEFNKTR